MIPAADLAATLAAAIEAGDTTAENRARWALTERVRPYLLRSVKVTTLGREDIEQDLLLTFALRAHKWNPGRGSLTTFAACFLRTYYSRCPDARAPLTLPARAAAIRRDALRLGIDAAAEKHQRSPADVSRMLSATAPTPLNAPAWPGGPDLAEVFTTDDGDGVTAPLDAARRAAVLRSALDLLPDQDRAALEARYGIGQPEVTVREYAQRIARARQRVNFVLLRGRKALHEILTSTLEIDQ